MARVSEVGLRAREQQKGVWAVGRKQTQRVASDGCAPPKVRLSIGAEKARRRRAAWYGWNSAGSHRWLRRSQGRGDQHQRNVGGVAGDQSAKASDLASPPNLRLGAGVGSSGWRQAAWHGGGLARRHGWRRCGRGRGDR
jgi:hypothetical protein